MQLTFRHTKYAAYVGYITQAIVNNLAPLLFVSFSHAFGLSLERISLLITLNFGVQILTDVFAARVVTRSGYRVLCVLAHIFAAAGLLGYALLPFWLPPYIGLAVSGMLCAIGGGLDEVVISPVVEALPGDEKASTMSLLHAFYCWGQVLVVLGSTLFFQLAGSDANGVVAHWRVLPCLWAAIPACNAVAFACVPIRTLEEEGTHVPLREILRQRGCWLLLAMMICAGASELAMSQWASLFAEEGLHVSKMVGDLLGPCAFALLMGVARTIYGVYGAKLQLSRVIWYSGLLCIGSYALATFAPHPLLSLVGCALSGLAVGILWPGTYSMAAARFPGGGAAMFALLALAGDLGCTAGPTLAGLIGDATGTIRIGLMAAVIFPLCLTVCTLRLRAVRFRTMRKSSRKT